MEVVGRGKGDAARAEFHQVAGEIVIHIGVFYQLFQRQGVDVDFSNIGGVELEVGTDVVEQLRREAVDLQELVGGDESAQPFAVADDTAGIGGADAVKQLQGDAVGTVELHGEGLPRRRRWRGGIDIVGKGSGRFAASFVVL